MMTPSLLIENDVKIYVDQHVVNQWLKRMFADTREQQNKFQRYSFPAQDFFTIKQRNTTLHTMQSIDRAQLHVVAQGLAARQRQRQPQQPEAQKLDFKTLPFHLCLEILDFIQKNLTVHSQQSSIPNREGNNTELSLWGRFSADPLRKPVFVWRSLLFKRFRSMRLDDDGSIRDKWVYQALSHVRYLRIDASLFSFLPGLVRRASRSNMPQLRQLQLPLLFSHENHGGVDIVQNRFLNERIVRFDAEFMDNMDVDVSKILPQCPNLLVFDAPTFCNYTQQEFECLPQLNRLSSLRTAVKEPDYKVLYYCKHVKNLALNLYECQDSSLQALLKALETHLGNSTKLRSLSMSAPEADVPIMLQQMPSCSSLTSLYVGGGLEVQSFNPRLSSLRFLRCLHVHAVHLQAMHDLESVSMHMDTLIIENIKNNVSGTEVDSPLFGVVAEVAKTRPLRVLHLPTSYLDQIGNKQDWIDGFIEILSNGKELIEVVLFDAQELLISLQDMYLLLLRLLQRFPHDRDTQLKHLTLVCDYDNDDDEDDPDEEVLAAALGLETLSIRMY